MNEIQSLEELVLDADFQKLSRLIESRSPNIFTILGIKEKEVYWSSFLGWLLNPNSNHNLGSVFLRDFLIDALKKGSSKTNVTALDVYLMNFTEVEVITEYTLNQGFGRADIVIKSYGNDKLLCIIENKVGSEEGFDQTKRYAKAGLKILADEKLDRVIYIFLTPIGTSAEDTNFISYSYVDLLNLLKQLETRVIGSTSVVSHFIQQFIQNIEEVTNMEQSEKEIRQLSRIIYSRHEHVIDTLIKYRPTQEAFFEELGLLIKKENQLFNYMIAKGWMAIYPSNWQKHGRGYTDLYYTISISNTGKILFRVEISGQFKGDRDKLKELTKTLINRQYAQNKSVKLCNEDWLLSILETDQNMPTSFDNWDEIVKQTFDDFKDFLCRFPVEEFEGISGVRYAPTN